MAKRARRNEAAGVRDSGVARVAVDAKSAEVAEWFYSELFSPEELGAVARAAAEMSLEDEVTLLKVMIRRAAAAGADLTTISRAVNCLAATLKVQLAIRDETARGLEEALITILDGVAEQLGLRRDGPPAMGQGGKP